MSIFIRCRLLLLIGIGIGAYAHAQNEPIEIPAHVRLSSGITVDCVIRATESGYVLTNDAGRTIVQASQVIKITPNDDSVPFPPGIRNLRTKYAGFSVDSICIGYVLRVSALHPTFTAEERDQLVFKLTEEKLISLAAPIIAANEQRIKEENLKRQRILEEKEQTERTKKAAEEQATRLQAQKAQESAIKAAEQAKAQEAETKARLRAIKELVEEMRQEQDAGEAPSANKDGSFSCVKEYLANNLNDPKSLEYVEWSKSPGSVTVKGITYWLILLKYRAKNGFGGLILYTQGFLIRAGKVVNIYSP